MTTQDKKTSFFTRFISVTLVASLIVCVIAPMTTTYAQEASGHGNGGTNQSPDTSKDGVTCAIEHVGWILCPIMWAVSKAADKTYEILANNFLQIEPELLTAKPAGGAGTITAWEYARNLANIAFIIAFLVIIYSQVTGTGLNNYGIKRMLPRLIIAAVAVNVSYYICQAMVDLSNILGFEVKDAITNVSNQIGPAVMGHSSQGTDTQTADGSLGTLSKITIGVLAFAAVAWIFIGVMGTVGVLVLITVVTIIMILLLRKAFIVILVVLSPLAFVAYLLPNTEKYFSKWLNMFWQLLMVFPIVALLFGGGQLASTIILVSGASANATQQQRTETANCNAGQGSPTPNVPQVNNGYNIPCEKQIEISNNGKKAQAGWMLGLVATGIAVAPLLFVWSVLKGALAAAGAIGGKLAGAIDNASKGKRKDLSDKYKDDKERRRQEMKIRAMDGKWTNPANLATLGSARREARRRARTDRTKARYNESYLGYVANSSIKTGKDGQPLLDENGNPQLTSFGRQLAGGIGPTGFGANQGSQMRAASDAVNAMRELEIKNVKAAHATIDNLDESQLEKVIASAKDKNDPQLAAALERMAKIGDKSKVASYADNVGRGGSSLASRSLGAALSGEGYLKSQDIDEISRGAMGSRGLEQRALDNINAGIYSPDVLANAGKAELDFVHKVARSGTSASHARARANLRSAATQAMGDDRLKIKLSRNKDVVSRMQSGNWQSY